MIALVRSARPPAARPRWLRHPPLTLLVSAAPYLLLRAPSFYERFWYGDEGIYASIATGLHHGHALYTQIWDSKPPGIFLIYFVAGFLPWSYALIALNLLAAALALTALMLLRRWLIGLKLRRATVAAGLIGVALCLGCALFEGTTRQIEVYFVPLNLMALTLLDDGPPLLLGLLVGLSFLLKPQATFETGALYLLFAAARWPGASGRAEMVRCGRVALAAATPILLCALWLLLRGGLGAAINATFLYNIGYTSIYGGQMDVLGLRADAQQLRIALLLGATVAALVQHRRGGLSRIGFVAIAVFVVEVYCATLSGRPYAHYLLQCAPGLGLLAAWATEAVCTAARARAAAVCAGAAAIVTIAMLIFYQGGWPDLATTRQYYGGFVQALATRGGWWRWHDGDDSARALALQRDYARIAGPGHSYVVYAQNSWTSALPNGTALNLRMSWYQLLDSTDALTAQIKLVSAADYLIVDTVPPGNDSVRFNALAQRFSTLPGAQEIADVDGFRFFRVAR